MPSAEPAALHAALAAHRGEFRLDVTLDLPAGSVTALIGPNGAGKSTVVAALAGLVPVDAGRVALGDVVLDDPSSGVCVPAGARRVATCFQDTLLFGGLSVLDNVAFGLRATGTPRRAARATALDLLDELGLADRATSRPSQLSGGQAARVGLARALAVDPKLLLLDEPLAAIDHTARTDLRAWLAEVLAERSVTTFLVTHDPDDAVALASAAVVLEAGRVVEHLPMSELARSASSYATRFGGQPA